MILRKYLKENWWKAAALLLLLEANLIVSILFYPDFKKNFDVISQFAFAKLQVVQDLFQEVGDGGFTAYFLLQHFFKALNVLGAVGAVFLGMGTICKEVENRTAEIYLSRPISRAKILSIHLGAGIFLLAIVVALSSATAPWLASHIDEALEPALVWTCALHTILFLSALYSFVLLISNLSSEQSKVVLFCGGFFVFMFLVYFVKQVTHLSIYRWNDLAVFLDIARNRYPYALQASLLAMTAILWSVSLWIFRRREF